MKVDSPKTSTWSSGGIGGQTAGAVGGGETTGKLPIQPGSKISSSSSTGTDSFDGSASTSSSTKVNLSGT